MSVVYFEGAFLPEEEAKIPITDRGFLFGDGAYATIQVRGGVPLFLEAHLERLQEQCRSFNLTMPSFSCDAIYELIRLNSTEEGIWRLKIFVTGGDSLETRLPEREGRLLMTLSCPHALSKAPLRMGLFPMPFSLCHAYFKSLAHLNRLFVTQEAYRQHVDDCITQTEKGYLLEASYGNIFWIYNGVFYTPDPSLPLYFGVTITLIMEIAQKLGYPIKKVAMPFSELPLEGIYFRTGSVAGICPIVQIGEKDFSRNERIEREFVEGYEKIIEEQVGLLSSV